MYYIIMDLNKQIFITVGLKVCKSKLLLPIT